MPYFTLSLCPIYFEIRSECFLGGSRNDKWHHLKHSLSFLFSVLIVVFLFFIFSCNGRYEDPLSSLYLVTSSSCTTTELSKLITSCLTAVKNHVIRYCEKVYKSSGKNLFRSIKNSGEVLNKLKSRGFRATSLSTYDFSTLYTTLPHNLIKEKLKTVRIALCIVFCFVQASTVTTSLQ